MEFFRFYAHDFNFRDHVACIREGRVLTKADKEWTTKHNTRRDRFWWCIEDPFELSHNLGRVADRDRCVRADPAAPCLACALLRLASLGW